MKIFIPISFVLIFLSSKLFAQKKNAFNYDYQVDYKYTFKPNKNDPRRISEKTVLFCSEQDFYFISMKNLEMRREIESGKGMLFPVKVTPADLKISAVTHYVFTTGKSVTVLERLGNRSFSYQEKPDLKWEILPDTQSFAGYVCQKAISSYGGRKWTAWFALDIPLSMGPYKFNDLPGLVLKVGDSQNEFSWQMTRFAKMGTTIPWGNFYNNKNYSAMSKKEFFEYRAKRTADPYTYDLLLNPSIKKVVTPNPEQARKAHNYRMTTGLSENNWIEIKL